jgi:hypothetical protein
VTPKFLPLLEQCIETGLTRGHHRAHKHRNDPTIDHLVEEQRQAIMAEIFEWFDFPEPPGVS